MKCFKLLLALAGATVLLGALASAASARNLSSSSSTFRGTFQRVTFNLPFGDTVCAVTVEGSLHSRTYAKVTGALIGYIDRARLGTCSTGRATVLTETLPWHYVYRSFSGTLPNIGEQVANLINLSLRVAEPFGITCLTRSTTSRSSYFSVRLLGREVVGATWGGTTTTGPECFSVSGTFSSDQGPYTVAGSSARITLTLI